MNRFGMDSLINLETRLLEQKLYLLRRYLQTMTISDYIITKLEPTSTTSQLSSLIFLFLF